MGRRKSSCFDSLWLEVKPGWSLILLVILLLHQNHRVKMALGQMQENHFKESIHYQAKTLTIWMKN